MSTPCYTATMAWKTKYVLDPCEDKRFGGSVEVCNGLPESDDPSEQPTWHLLGTSASWKAFERAASKHVLVFIFTSKSLPASKRCFSANSINELADVLSLWCTPSRDEDENFYALVFNGSGESIIISLKRPSKRRSERAGGFRLFMMFARVERVFTDVIYGYSSPPEYPMTIDFTYFQMTYDGGEHFGFAPQTLIINRRDGFAKRVATPGFEEAVSLEHETFRGKLSPSSVTQMESRLIDAAAEFLPPPRPAYEILVQAGMR